ncbi:hypothetical protein OG510_12450 [Streptomyces sp. NBC_01089]|nr:hypothetical protein OG510_12450 [Streptomyces sp. NBC_01089]
MIDRWDQEDDARRIRSRTHTIGEYFATEQPLLAPLPEDPFETGRLSTPRIDRYSQICVRMNRYSVPVRLIGRTVRVMLHASELVVYDGREEVARHERLIARGATRNITGSACVVRCRYLGMPMAWRSAATPARAGLQKSGGSRQEGLGPVSQRTEDEGQPFGDTLTDEVREVESHQSEAVRQYAWAGDLFAGEPCQFPARWIDIVHGQQRCVVECAGTTAERFDVDNRSHSVGTEQDVVQPEVAVHEVSGRQLDLPEGSEERVDGRDEPEPLRAWTGHGLPRVIPSAGQSVACVLRPAVLGIDVQAALVLQHRDEPFGDLGPEAARRAPGTYCWMWYGNPSSDTLAASQAGVR